MCRLPISETFVLVHTFHLLVPISTVVLRLIRLTSYPHSDQMRKSLDMLMIPMRKQQIYEREYKFRFTFIT